ncbi:MAG: bifunctional (p)ppGpp synthetase/guanosine-3',5'-bis(diphosphate) 3'-pyrophosphohydrolase, partial [Epulopiscium sp.]|nr:bifunctional (p)ppGpp synthetase/guanosine-3',5'-bis(diphosphate) 3'-pyrophosphohydrolase [Candidatus Epulonipiscium sp.]
VTIHRTDCINILCLTEEDRHRLIDAEWDMQAKEAGKVSYLAEIRVLGSDRVGLIMEVSRVLTDEDISVKAFSARTTKEMTAIFNITIEINGKEQLEKIIKRLMNIKDVMEIERVAN